MLSRGAGISAPNVSWYAFFSPFLQQTLPTFWVGKICLHSEWDFFLVHLGRGLCNQKTHLGPRSSHQDSDEFGSMSPISAGAQQCDGHMPLHAYRGLSFAKLSSDTFDETGQPRLLLYGRCCNRHIYFVIIFLLKSPTTPDFVSTGLGGRYE